VLGEDTELVIAHSLGTLVSYEVLADRPELSPAFITMGSPLATPFAFEQLKPAPEDGVGAWPGSVRSWTNIVAVGDPACGGKGLSARFTERVIDHMVDNGHRAHDPEPYLNAAVTGQAVEERASVTVIAPDGTTADALETSVYLLGPERGLKLIEEIPGTAAVYLRATPDGVRSFESSRFTTIPRTRPKPVDPGAASRSPDN